MATDIRPVRSNPALVFKLTDERMQTRGGYQWTLGETKRAKGEGPLCSSGWLHCYSDPRLALLFNPVHAGITHPRLFTARPGGVYRSDALKAGVSALTLVEELPLPRITTRGRVLFAIACARVVLPLNTIPLWDAWVVAYQKRLATKKMAYAAADAARAAYTAADAAADAARAAYTAARAAYTAADAAAYAAADAAAYAARTAHAAYTAARAAYAADAADAADAAHAAYTAARAAYAADAADAAMGAANGISIRFINIANSVDLTEE